MCSEASLIRWSCVCFFFSSRRRHTRLQGDWSSDVCSSDLIDLLKITSCGQTEVVATVASERGLPLPGQDVRFSSTAGRLFLGSPANPIDAANIPIRTDKFGNAPVDLITSTTATVTAKSGAASGKLTINTLSGNLSPILLHTDLSSR